MTDAEPEAGGDRSEPVEGARLRLIVGIGASAGGLEALESFFDHVPEDAQLTFVVVQHLDPTRASAMPELLTRHSRLPVRHAEDGTPVEPGHVYLIPPNAILTIRDGTLHLAPLVEATSTLIDHFFFSLAEDQGPNAVGVILSGAGTDGTLGLKAIKEFGGLTMAQSVESAKYDAMPRSAIALGMVDDVLPVEQMPARLIEYAEHIRTLRLERRAHRTDTADFAAALRTICAILQQRTGHDFSRYKQSTLVRRIQRRMQVSHAPSLQDYIERLRAEADEADQLFADLLIGVTHFFRDPEAFSALATQVVPALLEARKGEPREVRVWIAGCASGEEVYSVAILLREAMVKLTEPPPPVKIFATDIDEHALEIARHGRYPEGIAEHVSPDRLQRFFTKQGGMYQIDKQVREMCIFSLHNLISDPPFSRMSLIVCRNLLIYLHTDVQKNLVPMFHYALRPGGFLFLGPSEGLAASPELFTVLDKKHRIFRRNDVVIPPAITFPLVDTSRFARAAAPLAATPAHRAQDIAKTFERVLLENYAPASVVINERGEILYVSGRTGKYLELLPGATSVNVIDMARKGLRPDLHTAVHKAIKTREEIVHQNVLVEINGQRQRINLIVRPLVDLEPGSGLFMVVFQDIGPPMSKEEAEATVAMRPEEPLTQALENELRTTKEHLQTTIEELETSNEELKSANEELLSTNEEFQSANEELQTSKEELQSINEELQTVNGEMGRKVEELDRANSDLQNLFANTNVATVFLDTDLHVKKFSPTATELFRIIASDIGRPITDLAATFTSGDLVANVREVLRTLIPMERQVHREDGDQWYIQRIRPYRSLDNVIGGVVITFVDITELRRAQEQAADLHRQVELERTRLRMLVDHVPFGIGLTEAPSGRILLANPPAEELLRLMPVYSSHASPGEPSGLFTVDGQSVTMDQCPIARSLRGERIRGEDYLYRAAPEQMTWIRASAGPITADGAIVGAVIVLMDVDREKRAEEALKDVDRRKNEFLAMLGHELRNPLTPIRSAAHLLRRRVPPDPATLKWLDMIDRQVAYMIRIVDDLLDVSRIERGKILLRTEPVELVALVRTALEDLATRFSDRRISLDLRLPQGPVQVMGDPVRLTQVVTNLLHNAAKFTDPGGRIGVEVEVSGGPPDGEVSIHVRDNGIGMSGEMLERAFVPFAQADAGVGRGGGLGLGLAVVKGLVELHGGSVSAESAGPGRGSHFTIRLPVSALGEVAPPPAPVEGPAAEARECRVLVIEDNDDISESIREILEGEGHAVAVASTGAEGIEKAMSFLPDVVLCDIGLPGGMDGHAVARALRADPRLSSASLVAMTGYGQEEDQRRARESGFDMHVTKPPDLEWLIRFVTKPPRGGPAGETT